MQIDDAMAPGRTYMGYSYKTQSQRLRLWLCKKILEVLLPKSDCQIRVTNENYDWVKPADIVNCWSEPDTNAWPPRR